MKNLLKLLFIGVITTVVRVIGQLSIPAGEQTVLQPSVFAQNGTMPLAFTVYGVLAYSFIAALFLLIRNQMGGNRILQGLKYGIACCVIWIAYLWEPLPHVAPLDRVTYPIADSLALLVMGLLLGWLLAKPGRSANRPIKRKKQNFFLPIFAITGCFLAARLVQYLYFDIYSAFDYTTTQTLLWALLTGFAVACVTAWLYQYIGSISRIKTALVLGGLLFGVDLALFNFFMPLVFDADIPDLILRTVIDILAVTLGCLTFSNKQGAPERG